MCSSGKKQHVHDKAQGTQATKFSCNYAKEQKIRVITIHKDLCHVNCSLVQYSYHYLYFILEKPTFSKFLAFFFKIVPFKSNLTLIFIYQRVSTINLYDISINYEKQAIFSITSSSRGKSIVFCFDRYIFESLTKSSMGKSAESVKWQYPPESCL